jgi:hypothetical protein
MIDAIIFAWDFLVWPRARLNRSIVSLADLYLRLSAR